MQNKGRRFCFVAAIGGEGLSERAGIIPNSLWLFCPTAKKDSEGDYHKVFNRETYVAWFKNQLLPNLHEPSLIILDNAKYHKTKPASTPNVSKLKKAEIFKILTELEVIYDANITATEAKLLLRK